MRTRLNSCTVGLLVAASLALATPAHADLLLVHEDWACDVPYSGELQCAPTVLVPPGGYLWVGIGNGGPTLFTVYQDAAAGRTQVGWMQMRGGEGRPYANTTGAPVVVEVTMHEDAPTNRCGTRFEHGFVEVRV
ncbi:hypothetical protein ABIA33_001865 [Streptacidiphilus sp. MAP12-16]|uniref:hypothetical protein n=1 Tax=Streptacidiphilus sp. MAP12-16 TaxID=3156300 RepID=UPI003511B698